MMSKEIIQIIGGKDYLAGTSALRILSISLGFAVFAGFFCCCVMFPFKQEKQCLIVSLISAGINISLNFAVIPFMSFNGTALTTLLSEAVVLIIYIILSKKYISIVGINKVLFSTVIGCIGIVISCSLIQTLKLSVYPHMLLSVILSVVVYVSILIACKNEIAMLVLSILVKWKK
jgi:O-antigen/teichoic acid export membrane protein